MAALSRSTARPSLRRTSTAAAAAAASRPPPPPAATASAAIPSAAVPDPAATPLRMAASAIAATADVTTITTTTSTIIITTATTMRTPTRRTMASPPPPPAPTSWTRSSAVMTLWALLLSACCLTQCWSGAEAAISNRASKPQVAAIQPRFLSRGHTYRAVVGDTLVLPCEVENLGALVLLWRRGPNVLTASQLMVTQDERIRLMDGYNLEISELEPQDAGDYVCQISDKVNKDQVHTVEILVPPSIRAVPQTGQLTARKGGTITLECKASGNPVPSIFWTKKSDTTANNGDGGSIGSTGSTSGGNSGSRSRNVRSYHRAQPKDTTPSQQQQQQQLLQAQPAMRIGDGPILTLERVERQQAGIYQCTADNNVGEPVTVDMRLDVLYPPDISVEKSWIHSGEGFEAQLVCIVHADPAPTVSWLQNSFPLQQTDRRTMASRGNRHSLNIRHVQPEDFGNYSCVADNSLGRSKKYMEVSGRPGPAEFHSSPWSRSQDSYNLTWKVDSYPPLQEVRLLYRKLMVNETFQQPGRWHDVILTPTPRASSEPLSHIMSFTLKGLQPTSVYEAIVQAKNRYGWNEVSDIFQFHTQRSSLEPRTVELEMVASSTSRSGTSPIRAAVCGSTLTVAAILVAVWSVRRGV